MYIINLAVHLLTIAAKYRSQFLINRINTTVTLALGLKLGVNRETNIVDPEYPLSFVQDWVGGIFLG